MHSAPTLLRLRNVPGSFIKRDGGGLWGYTPHKKGAVAVLSSTDRLQAGHVLYAPSLMLAIIGPQQFIPGHVAKAQDLFLRLQRIVDYPSSTCTLQCQCCLLGYAFCGLHMSPMAALLTVSALLALNPLPTDPQPTFYHLLPSSNLPSNHCPTFYHPPNLPSTIPQLLPSPNVDNSNPQPTCY